MAQGRPSTHPVLPPSPWGLVAATFSGVTALDRGHLAQLSSGLPCISLASSALEVLGSLCTA